MPSKIPILDEKDLNALIEQALNGNGVLVTPKELSQMITHIPGVSINSKPRKDGRFQGYVVDANGRTYAYGFTRDEVAYKLKQFLKFGTPKRKKKETVLNGVPTTFTSFATYYFENFRKKKVAELTYKIDVRRFEKNLAPYFKESLIKNITPLQCQKLLDSLTEQGKGKTADEVHSLMSIIFKNAIKHGITSKNPLDVVYHEKHETNSGKALSPSEEQKLKDELKDSPFLPFFMFALYTGLRPNEYKTAYIDGEFIIANNSKRKNKKVEYKRIPIIKALKPFVINGLPKIPRAENFRKVYKSILPNHIIYDLRTTFYSRCKEFEVSDHALNEFMGHSLGPIGNAYTDLSNEYLLKESKKLDDWQ